MILRCARCNRPIRQAIVVEGRGFGPSCAAKVGDLLVQPMRRATAGRRARRTDTRQLALEVTP